MIRKVRLKSFMSHRDTLIELADGVTVIFGPNNCGKSALVAAIQAVCRNDAQSYAIRHGEKEATVTIETDDGHVVTWNRKAKGTVVYTVVDGKEIPPHRARRGGRRSGEGATSQARRHGQGLL